ncbi:MAG: aspartate aminotransferase family protein [Anaerolineae bacterium]|nr:aspartate aminotransferase family protein [Anaerolineae bacterium]
MSISKSIVEHDKQVVSPAIYRTVDIAFERGEGSYLYDADGKRYHDLSAGIATNAIGHCHPKVVQAVQAQAANLMHVGTPVGHTRLYADMLDALRATMPAPLSNGKGVLMNSGGEAVETALKMARMVTRRPMVLAFTESFHGRPMGALAATASNSGYRKSLGPLLNGFQHVPYPNCGSCVYGHAGRTPDNCCGAWKNMIQMMLDKLVHPDDLAAILVEPIAGEGGYLVPPPDFLPFLRDICNKTGALLITDEVQTGLGRTGKWWGFEHSGIVPDIVAMGKAIGGGLPLGGIMAIKPVADRWPTGSHGSTFGGNPVACAAGLATLEVMKEENALENAAKVGAHIAQRIVNEQSGLPLIAAVRGRGMMIAADLKNKDGKPISMAQHKQVVHDIAANGVIVTKTGSCGLRLAPSLNLSQQQADQALDIIFDVLHELSPQLY